MFDQPRIKQTGSNLPALFLIFGICSVMLVLLGVLSSDSSLTKRSDLRTISGIVQRAPYISGSGGKQGRYLHVVIDGADGPHNLTQTDMGHMVPGIMEPIMNLRVGDSVIARVEHDPLGRGIDFLWELQRDGETILSYQDTYLFFERLNARRRKIGVWGAVLAFIFFLTAFQLRRHFGAWQAIRKPA